MKLGKVVAVIEKVSGANIIEFVRELSFAEDLELRSALLASREDGFPDGFSFETEELIHESRHRSWWHSWTRLFGLQVAYDRYSKSEGFNMRVADLLLGLINEFSRILNDRIIQQNDISEPRLVFWFERSD